MIENSFKENARAMIKVLVDCSFVFFTTRSNESIKIAMHVLAKLHKHTVLFQEEGGWMTYEKYIRKAGLEPLRLITNDGLIYPKELTHYGQESGLLLNSLAGYVALHDMDVIMTTCAVQDIFLVNDVAGSIGTPQAKIGDIILGSFGKAKPVNLGKGGFIATNDSYIAELIEGILTEDESSKNSVDLNTLNEDDDGEGVSVPTKDELKNPVIISEPQLDYQLLGKKLQTLHKRRVFLQDRCKKIKADLSDCAIVHKEDAEALNVIIRFENHKEKQKIVSYCEKEDLEYTECPREIRILDDAISIEVKRLLDDFTS